MVPRWPRMEAACHRTVRRSNQLKNTRNPQPSLKALSSQAIWFPGRMSSTTTSTTNPAPPRSTAGATISAIVENASENTSLKATKLGRVRLEFLAIFGRLRGATETRLAFGKNPGATSCADRALPRLEQVALVGPCTFVECRQSCREDGAKRRPQRLRRRRRP